MYGLVVDRRVRCRSESENIIEQEKKISQSSALFLARFCLNMLACLPLLALACLPLLAC